MRRRIVVLAVLVDLTAPAMSCPPLESCVVKLPSTTRVSSAHGPAPHATLDLTKLAAQTEPPPPPDPSEIEMPWIWNALRARVYSRMPTYEQHHGLKIVLSPVVVTSPSDTVPGLGIAGDF